MNCASSTTRAAAAAVGFGTRQGPHYDPCSTADARVDRYRVKGAVSCTGAAFHACVEVPDVYSLPRQFKNVMRAYLRAHTASNAPFFIQSKRAYIFKVLLFH